MKTKINILAAFVLLAFVATCSAEAPGKDNLDSFNLVWQTVQTDHFDPTFGGVDWKAMPDRYLPQILSFRDLGEFSRVTNQMLFELNLSHFLVASDDMLKTYMPTLFSEGTVGMEVRWLQKKAVITKTKSGSPGHTKGLIPGYVITGIDGQDVNDILRSAQILPPYNMRNFRGGVSNYLTGHLNGPPNTSVEITYLDENSQLKKVKIVRQARGAGRIINDATPPVFIEFEAFRLKENIGYVWFNHFVEPVDKKFFRALETMHDTRGLIVDVRNNPGGYFRVLDAIIASLITEETLLYRFQFRDKTVERTLIPSENPYRKPVAVLIDATTTSASELFAACLQAIGRAEIVGEHSPGYLLGAKWMKLPNGLSFMSAFLQPIPIDGRVVEGNGVEPDIEIGLTRNRLLMGKDNQLEAAIAHILRKSEP